MRKTSYGRDSLYECSMSEKRASSSWRHSVLTFLILVFWLPPRDCQWHMLRTEWYEGMGADLTLSKVAPISTIDKSRRTPSSPDKWRGKTITQWNLPRSRQAYKPMQADSGLFYQPAWHKSLLFLGSQYGQRRPRHDTVYIRLNWRKRPRPEHCWVDSCQFLMAFWKHLTKLVYVLTNALSMLMNGKNLNVKRHLCLGEVRIAGFWKGPQDGSWCQLPWHPYSHAFHKCGWLTI